MEQSAQREGAVNWDGLTEDNNPNKKAYFFIKVINGDINSGRTKNDLDGVPIPIY